MQHERIYQGVLLLAIMGSMSSCGRDQYTRPQSKQYGQLRQLYYAIVQEYIIELELCAGRQLGADQVRRCVLTHADQIHKQLGFGAFITGRSGRYTSYPFLEYAHDLDAVVLQLNKALRKLISYEASHCVQLSKQLQELRGQLQEFRSYVISHERYLVEQDKWDKAIINQNQQAALNAVLAQAHQAKSAREVHVYHK